MTTATLAFPGVLPKSKPEQDYQSMSDLDLANLSSTGDMRAFEVIYLKHHNRTYSLCLRMTQNSHLAEDLTQDVFVQLFRKIGTFKGDSQFTTWLHRLTVNQVLMHFRKRTVKMEKTVGDEEKADTLGVNQIVPGTENPLRLFVLDRIALKKAIDKLPKGYKNVFILHDVEGYEHWEVAKILGCSEGTSKSQLHKARSKLKHLLEKKARISLSTLTDAPRHA